MNQTKSTVAPPVRYRYAAPLHHAIDLELQNIELASFYQIPGFQIIGLPSQEVAEAKERIRSAILASGFKFPQMRLVANLAPAGVRKRGTGSDLALALAILENQQIDQEKLKRESGATDAEASPGLTRYIVASGELGLEGALKPVGRPLRTWLSADENHADALIVHPDDAAEIRRLRESLGRQSRVVIISATTLKEAWARRSETAESCSPPRSQKTIRFEASTSFTPAPLLSPAPYIRRLGLASLAGMHHLLLLGPRGCGKSSAIEWIAQHYRAVDPRQAMQGQVIRELSLNGSTRGGGNQSLQQNGNAQSSGASGRSSATIRRVSPQTRPASLEGGFQAGLLIPGELALAHGGVVIADEFAEWPRDSRELLRIPLERKCIQLNRLGHSAEIPTDFLLLATSNTCPCGGIHCRCSDRTMNDYFTRLSGPILDRIDMVVRMVAESPNRPNTSFDLAADLTADFATDPVAEVQQIRERLMKNWGVLPGTLSGEETEALIQRTPELALRLKRAQVNGLRSRHKVFRLALTLAALDDRAMPELHHFHEAKLLRLDVQTEAKEGAESSMKVFPLA